MVIPAHILLLQESLILLLLYNNFFLTVMLHLKKNGYLIITAEK